MHEAAYKYVSRFASSDPLQIIEIGSRDINGSIRPLFPLAQWIGLDLHAGPSVDVVCDALDYVPPRFVDAVVCCEVLEHAPYWDQLLIVAGSWLKAGGRLMMTCAGTGRQEHSAIDGGELRELEYYKNLTKTEVESCLLRIGLFTGIQVEENGEDTYATAVRRGTPLYR